jgi:HK97 family phage prohead protease
MQIDRRSVQCRAEVDGSTVSGLAIPYETESQPLPFIETIAGGAFADDLGKRNVAMLIEHDGGRVLADTRSGTLVLEEGQRGVSFRAQLPDTRDGQDMRVLLRDGIYQHMSFGFVAEKDDWQGNRRTVLVARLYEVSLVHTPAYEATAAAVRAFAHHTSLVGRYLRLRMGALKNDT